MPRTTPTRVFSKHFCLIPKEGQSCADAADCEKCAGQTPGAEKADARRGKGKRGGLRIIYLYLPEFQRVIFLDIYDKDEADDLTAEERREFAAVAQAIRLEFQRQA